MVLLLSTPSSYSALSDGAGVLLDGRARLAGHAPLRDAEALLLGASERLAMH